MKNNIVNRKENLILVNILIDNTKNILDSYYDVPTQTIYLYTKPNAEFFIPLSVAFAHELSHYKLNHNNIKNLRQYYDSEIEAWEYAYKNYLYEHDKPIIEKILNSEYMHEYRNFTSIVKKENYNTVDYDVIHKAMILTAKELFKSKVFNIYA